MGFFKGALDQWNLEEAMQEKRTEREEDMAFKKDTLSTQRQLALLKVMGPGRRGPAAASKAKAQTTASAALWVQQMIPEGTPGRKEYVEMAIRNPGVAVDLKKLYDGVLKSKGELGETYKPTGEEFMNTFFLAESNPELLEGADTWEDLQKEIMTSDMSEGKTAVDLTSRAMGLPSLNSSAAVVVDPDVYTEVGPKQITFQNDFLKTQINVGATKYIRENLPSLAEGGHLETLGLTLDSATAEWNRLVQSYIEEGDTEAGIIVTNTLKTWDAVNLGAQSAPLLSNYNKNPSTLFLPVLTEVNSGDTRNFGWYLQQKAKEAQDRGIVDGGE